jgi:hypothetical protein
MAFFDCKSKDAEIYSLKKDLLELREDLSWYIQMYGVKSASTGGLENEKPNAQNIDRDALVFRQI